MWASAGLWIIISAGLTAWTYVQSDGSVTVRTLPVWFAGYVLFGALLYGIGWYWKTRKKPNRAVAISVVPDGGGMLVIERGGTRSLHRLADGAAVTDPSVAAAPLGASHRIDLQDGTVLFGDDVARLWFTGELRRTLHGLQPQPATPLEFIKGRLVTTKDLLKTPPTPLPIVVFHLAALDDDNAELLTLVSLDGRALWQVSFDEPMIRRAHQMFVTPDHLVFELGSRGTEYDMDGKRIRTRGRDNKQLVIIARATGASWRMTP